MAPAEGTRSGLSPERHCVLPRTDDHLRALRLIENEIAEMRGESILLNAAPFDRAQSDKVVARFKADRDEEYRELLSRCGDFEAEIAKRRAIDHFSYAEIEENEQDLKKLKTWLTKIEALDFYGALILQEARARVASCEVLLDAYAHDVFSRADENRSS